MSGILPCSAMANAPEISMLCGMSVGPHYRRLFTTSHLSIKSSTLYGAVGAGELIASILLGRRYPVVPSVRDGVMLMAHALMHVKDRVDGCGDQSAITFLHNGKIGTVTQEKVDELEDEFRRYEVIEAELLHYLIGARHNLSETVKNADLIKESLDKILPINPEA